MRDRCGLDVECAHGRAQAGRANEAGPQVVFRRRRIGEAGVNQDGGIAQTDVHQVEPKRHDAALVGFGQGRTPFGFGRLELQGPGQDAF